MAIDLPVQALSRSGWSPVHSVSSPYAKDNAYVQCSSAGEAQAINTWAVRWLLQEAARVAQVVTQRNRRVPANLAYLAHPWSTQETLARWVLLSWHLTLSRYSATREAGWTLAIQSLEMVLGSPWTTVRTSWPGRLTQFKTGLASPWGTAWRRDIRCQVTTAPLGPDSSCTVCSLPQLSACLGCDLVEVRPFVCSVRWNVGSWVEGVAPPGKQACESYRWSYGSVERTRYCWLPWSKQFPS